MSVPTIRHWLAGDKWNAENLNEIGDQINWLKNPPMIHLRRRNTVQTITGGTNVWTKVRFDTLVNNYNPFEFTIDLASAPDILFVQEPGWYSCEIYTAWQSFGAVDTRVIMGLFKNTFDNQGLLLRNDTNTQPSVSTNINMHKEGTFFFNVGDFVHLGVYHDDSSLTHNLANTSDAESSGLRMRWVST
jgi:hypothetical protein